MNSTWPSRIKLKIKERRGVEKRQKLPRHPEILHPSSLQPLLPSPWHSKAGQQAVAGRRQAAAGSRSRPIARREGFYPQPQIQLMFLKSTKPRFYPPRFYFLPPPFLPFFLAPLPSFLTSRYVLSPSLPPSPPLSSELMHLYSCPSLFLFGYS